MKEATQKLNRHTVKQDRKTKSDMEPSQLKEKWIGEANSLAISHPSPGSGKSIFGTKLDSEFAIEHTRERSALFTETELRLQSLTRNLGRNTFEKIAADLSQNSALLTLKRGQSLTTSERQVAEELGILKIAREGKNRFEAIGSGELAEKISLKRQHTDGQKEALKKALTTKDQVMIWNGVAGSGKTFALADLKETASKKGYKVIGLAPDASTAQTLGKSIGASASTIHSYLLKWEPSQRKTLLIIDESSRISTKLMSRLLGSVQNSHTRILFTGDYRQLGAVEAGNPFGSLMKSGISTAHLNEHRRQKDPKLKQAVEHISKGRYEDIRTGLEKISDHIFERKGHESRINFILNRYLSLGPSEREKTLVLADTNKEKDILTQRIREGLKRQGQLDKTDFKIQVLSQKDMTEAQKKAAAYYEPGMIVMTNAASPYLKVNEQYSVVDRRGKSLLLESRNGRVEIDPRSESLSVFEPKVLDIAKGDVLEWRKNHNGHLNRERVFVEAINEKKAVLRNEDGSKEKIDLTKKQLLDYAHVKTTYSSQGLTCDRVLALTHSNLSKESLYVLASRAEHEVEIVTDSKEKLLSRASRTSAKANVLDSFEMKEALALTNTSGKQLEIER